MNSLEIQDKKAQLKKRANEICEQCKVEIRDFTEAEQTEIDNIKTQIEDLNDELRKLDVEISSDNTKTNLNKTKMNKEFRLIKAINDIANNRNLDNVSSAVVNAGAEEMRKAGLSFGGQIQLPVENRATITVTAEGEDVVEIAKKFFKDDDIILEKDMQGRDRFVFIISKYFK